MNGSTQDPQCEKFERLAPEGWEYNGDADTFILDLFINDDFAVGIDWAGHLHWFRQDDEGWERTRLMTTDHPGPLALGILYWNHNEWFSD